MRGVELAVSIDALCQSADDSPAGGVDERERLAAIDYSDRD
jgi:hypothetical protein